MKTVTGNILHFKEGIIVQSCNIEGIMGSGLARQIKDLWPNVYRKYHISKREFGDVIYVNVEGNDSLCVANIIGQDLEGEGTKHWALLKGLERIGRGLASTNIPVYIPEGIGSVRGGGNRELILHMVEVFIPSATIVKYLGE